MDLKGDIGRTDDSSVKGEGERAHAASRDQVNGPKEAEFATHDVDDPTDKLLGTTSRVLKELIDLQSPQPMKGEVLSLTSSDPGVCLGKRGAPQWIYGRSHRSPGHLAQFIRARSELVQSRP